MAKDKNDGARRRNPFWNSDHNSFSKYAVVATALFIVFTCFFSGNSVIDWVRAGMKIKYQEKQMEFYRKDIERMDKEIESLSQNKDSLEKFARENFHFAAPGDDVYIEER